jgi:bifunctional DNase/RNase
VLYSNAGGTRTDAGRDGRRERSREPPDLPARRRAQGDLPIWIGNNEADAIVIQLQNVPVPRPQTHDLLKSVISQLGAKVSHIVVNDLNDEVFYARINVDLDGRHVEIDSRPSDAIALAVRMQAPIYAEDSVLERAGVALDAESEEVEASSRSAEGQSESSSVDPERLPAAFRDFINTLDLDDLGRGGQGKR